MFDLAATDPGVSLDYAAEESHSMTLALGSLDVGGVGNRKLRQARARCFGDLASLSVEMGWIVQGAVVESMLEGMWNADTCLRPRCS